MEVQTYLNKRDKVESIKAKAEEELRWTLADAQNRKDQAMKVTAMNQYMMTQAAMERNEQMERHAAYEKQLAMDQKHMQMEKQFAQSMHQKAVE